MCPPVGVTWSGSDPAGVSASVRKLASRVREDGTRGGESLASDGLRVARPGGGIRRLVGAMAGVAGVGDQPEELPERDDAATRRKTIESLAGLEPDRRDVTALNVRDLSWTEVLDRPKTPAAPIQMVRVDQEPA